MKITNKRGLPFAVVRAAENDSYSKEGADFTSTQLANPPRSEALKTLFPEKLEIDVTYRCASMLGQGVHNVLEKGARPGIDIIEKRFFWEFNGYKLGGRIDLYETDSQILYEYKTCLAGAFSKKNGKGQKPEWIAQANVNLELMRLNGLEPKQIIVVGWLKDWADYLSGSDGYPEAPIMTAEAPIWPREKTAAYILGRLKLHSEALKILPFCTSKETWGGKMCKSYCESSSICSQYQETKKTGIFQEE